MGWGGGGRGAEMEGGKEGSKLFLSHILSSVSHRCFRERHWQGRWGGGGEMGGSSYLMLSQPQRFQRGRNAERA